MGDIVFGGEGPFVLIAGPCVIESESHRPAWPASLQVLAKRLRVPFIFKASYEQANRTSGRSFRGQASKKAWRILAAIKTRLSVPILTDIPEPAHAAVAAEVADVLQIPRSSAGRRSPRGSGEDRSGREHQEGAIPCA